MAARRVERNIGSSFLVLAHASAGTPPKGSAEEKSRSLRSGPGKAVIASRGSSRGRRASTVQPAGDQPRWAGRRHDVTEWNGLGSFTTC